MKTGRAISDHFVEVNKTIQMPESAEKEDHFVGFNKMVGCGPAPKDNL